MMACVEPRGLEPHRERLAFVGGLGGACGARRRCAVARRVRVTRCTATREAVDSVKMTTFPESSSRYYAAPSPVPEVAQMVAENADVLSIVDLWERQASSDSLALVDEHHDEKISWTFAEANTVRKQLAAALSQWGIFEGSVVAMFADSSARATVVDAAVLTAGGAVAARGAAAPIDELVYIYQHSGSVALVAATSALATKLVKKLDWSEVQFIVVLWGSVDPEIRSGGFRVFSFDEVISFGKESPAHDRPPTTRNSLAALLYTSGTTGFPKGVPLTHGNILHEVLHISIDVMDPRPDEVFLSILPVWHIFEKTAQQFFLARGTSIAFTNTKNFRNDLAKYRPHYLVGVPRVFDVVFKGVISKMEKATALRKTLFFFFFSVTRAYIFARRTAQGLTASVEPVTAVNRLIQALVAFLLFPLQALAQVLVWKKIRDGLGGRHKASICGGGKLGADIEDFFECAKLDILVGYGLTETSPVLCNRTASHNVRHSCGLPMPGTSVRVVDPETRQPAPRGTQGLVLGKGPQVFRGYYKNEEATKKAFDTDGYFNTGDLGWWSSQGDLVISGRYKDVIVLSNGENIEPEALENLIAASAGIDQAILCGQDERHIAALLVPSLEFLDSQGWIDKDEVSKLVSEGNRTRLREIEAEVMEVPDAKKYFDKELVDRVRNREGFRPEENVRAWRLLLEGFSEENRLMTQTLKVKRNEVYKLYEKEIAALFAS